MFDMNSAAVSLSDTMPPPSGLRPLAAPPIGYPLDLELLESAVRAGRTTLRAALLDAYRLGRTKPRAISAPQDALLRLIGDGATPGELSDVWGSVRRVPVGFRPRVLARTLGALLKLGLVSVADGRVVLTAAGMVSLQAA